MNLKYQRFGNNSVYGYLESGFVFLGFFYSLVEAVEKALKHQYFPRNNTFFNLK
jgi:hypothetical protein